MLIVVLGSDAGTQGRRMGNLGCMFPLDAMNAGNRPKGEPLLSNKSQGQWGLRLSETHLWILNQDLEVSKNSYKGPFVFLWPYCFIETED